MNKGDRCAVSFLLFAAAAACGRASPAPLPAALAPVSEQAELLYLTTSGIRDSGQVVVRDNAAYRDLWRRATSAQSNPVSAPAVDFSRDMIVMVAGGRMSPADQIHVDSVGVRRESTASGKPRDVLAVVYSVREACSRLNGDAFPVDIVRVQHYPGEVRFVAHRTRGSDCR
jgi:hypothetical protein